MLQADARKWSQTLGPSWKERVEDKKKNHGVRTHENMGNKGGLRRSRKFRRFVMNMITDVARDEELRQLSIVEDKFRAMEDATAVDDDLREPWLHAMSIANRFVIEEGNDRMQRDLDVISEHVRDVYVKHREQMNLKGGSPKKDKKGVSFTELPIEVRQDKIRALSQEFMSRPGPEDVLMEEEEVRRLRASYAYHYDSMGTRKWTRFPWDVAMRELCAIKGEHMYVCEVDILFII